MQTDLLFDQFDTLLATPDDVAHLEAAVLQLAVQGKLVPQDPDDEPATELFERIVAERERLVREGQIRKPKPLPPIEADEIPYELPESWSWVRLGEATNYGTSDKVKPSDIADDTWVLDLQDIEKVTSRLLARVKFSERRSKSSKTVFHKGDVLYGKLRPYLDKVLVVDADGVCSSEIIPIRGYLDIDPYYLRYALKRPDFIAYVNSKTYGVKMPRLGTPDARMALLPLPPLAEQKRIVAKVDELLAQTRALAAHLEQADAALVPAAQAAFQSLLDAQDATEQDEARRRAAWQRIADHFDALTSDPRTIEALKQTVLQLAVQGKLVPQDPNDEPATELLKRIRAEREQLVREGEISNPRDIPPIDPDEVPFALPDGWVWSRLGESTVIVLGQSPPSTTYNSVGEGLPFYQGKKDFGEMYPTPTQWCSEPKKIAQKDDVLISVRAPVGPTNLCEEESCIGRGLAAIRSLAGVSPFYLLYMMRAFEADLSGKGFGTTFTAITGKDLRRFLIPLPPRAEQKRIVAKVDALLALCDALAAEVAAAEEVRARLLRAVLDGG